MARTNLTNITKGDLKAIAEVMSPRDTVTVTLPTELAKVVLDRRAEKEAKAGKQLHEYRLGGRNFIRPTDNVKVAHSSGKRDGFIGTVQRILEKPNGTVEIEVFGGPASKVPAIRTFTPERLSRTRSAPTHRTAAEKRAAKESA